MDTEKCGCIKNKNRASLSKKTINILLGHHITLKVTIFSVAGQGLTN